MELSSEDDFRLNVLLANKPLAIRIDESKMVVYGLSDNGEAKVPLRPQGRDDTYLKKVRELLSGHVTGSPGGYPVFLKRWTRMGQMRDESLAQLLLLGEPEAVTAAVCSPGITDELARRAWWIMQDAENARRMLERPAVAEGSMGKVLAEFLLEFLPFETETEKMADSVRLMLQPGLLTQAQCTELWRKSLRKQAYQVGFLLAMPDSLPREALPHPDFARLADLLQIPRRRGNLVAGFLLRVLDAPGQAFLATAHGVLTKPPTQDVVTATLDAVQAYFSDLAPEKRPDLPLEVLVEEADHWTGDAAPADVSEILVLCADCCPLLRAARVCAGLGYGVVRPVFRDTSAMGTLMRRKLEPVLDPIGEFVELLCAARK